MESLGEWITQKWVDLGNYSDGAKTAIGYREFKIRFKMTKKNQEYVRAMMMGDSPKFYSRWIDLTVDVWGGSGPDCRIVPVQAG